MSSLAPMRDRAALGWSHGAGVPSIVTLFLSTLFRQDVG